MKPTGIAEVLRHVITTIRHYSLLGLLRYFRLKIQRKKLAVAGQCKLCGQCCRRISLEAKGGWIRSETQFARVVRDYPEYQRFVPEGRDSQGFLLFSCRWCSSEGLCWNHADRLPICRDFPDPSLYFCGGALPTSCGYSFFEQKDFSRILDRELHKH